MSGPSLFETVEGLLREALRVSRDPLRQQGLEAALARLESPLRVAIAGKVKGGKSTLLNALVGEKLAPTDAGECTKIVTWYEEGLTYAVTALCADGRVVELPFVRDEGAIDVALGTLAPHDIDHLRVAWPASTLAALTLIDTPGLDSLSGELGERTRSFLTPDDESVTPADAVVFLMRHVHTSDMRFLEAFHDDGMARAAPINAIGVLSRADEIGGGRLDSMESAKVVAERYRRDASMRRLCQTVVPVAGLLAEAGTTLRESEFRALRSFASLPRAHAESLLLSVDRFGSAEVQTELGVEERRHLLERLGLFGVRLAVALLRGGAVTTSHALAVELVRRSGLTELQEVLASQFAARSGILKARSGLRVLENVLASRAPEYESLAQACERIHSSAHELAEIRLLNAIRVGDVGFGDGEVEDAERLLGALGSAECLRLGLPASSSETALRQSALLELERWQRRAENPMSSRATVDAARVLVRTCEGIVDRS